MNSSGEYMKLVMLGEGRVGKTSLTLRFCQDHFDSGQQSTINASYLEQPVTLPNNEIVNVAIWDTAGQEQFHALTPLYYRDALGAIIVYDITFQESFDRVQKWIEELQTYGGKNMVIAIAGNKCDDESRRQISKEEADKYAAGFGIKHFNTSAKTKTGVEEVFGYVVQEISDQKQSKKGKKGGLIVGQRNSANTSTSSSYTPPPDKEDSPPVPPQKGGEKAGKPEQIQLGETQDKKQDKQKKDDGGCC